MTCNTGKIKHVVVSGQWHCKCGAVDYKCQPRDYETLLLDLLAVLHRDGGHYVGEHGLRKAYNDAIDKALKAYHSLDSLRDYYNTE